MSHLLLTINTTTHVGIYPAVDPLDSTSRMLDPRVIGDLHYQTGNDNGAVSDDDDDNGAVTHKYIHTHSHIHKLTYINI